jgi:hypothetical protein
MFEKGGIPMQYAPKSPILVGGPVDFYPKFEKGKSNIRLTRPLSGMRNGNGIHKDIKIDGGWVGKFLTSQL